MTMNCVSKTEVGRSNLGFSKIFKGWWSDR